MDPPSRPVALEVGSFPAAQGHRSPPSRFWRRTIGLVALFGCAVLGRFFAAHRPGDGSVRTIPLPQQAYVWQRDWTLSVHEALKAHGREMAGLVVLGAEVAWKRDGPQVFRVALDHSLLRSLDRPVGLCLRMGGYSGTFATNTPAARVLDDLVRGMIAEAVSNRLDLAEFQIDFDCAESRLDGYRRWLEQLRPRLGRISLTITALPAWLKRREFRALARATDGYVLQVHSLDRPRDVRAPFILCDPDAARRAVATASQLGVPFRVALPTYGYLVAFDAGGQFMGLSAEGPASGWPEGTQFRIVSTDPASMVGLVRDWTSQPPPGLTGILWYRFPTHQDKRNWRWPTLATVMRGEFPAPLLRLETRRSNPSVTELFISNEGTGNYLGPVTAHVSWTGARLEARDGLAGFESIGESAETLDLRSDWVQLGPGERRVAGWLRLTEEREVQSELETQ